MQRARFWTWRVVRLCLVTYVLGVLTLFVIVKVHKIAEHHAEERK